MAPSTASNFFDKAFGGHLRYQEICSDKTKLIGAMKLLNLEYTPRLLYGAKPPGNGYRDDDRDDEE